jgi:hypothetical protein
MDSNEKCETVPPESKSRKAKNDPVFPKFVINDLRASPLIPGTGMFAAIRKITRRIRVMISLRRISCDFHR